MPVFLRALLGLLRPQEEACRLSPGDGRAYMGIQCDQPSSKRHIGAACVRTVTERTYMYHHCLQAKHTPARAAAVSGAWKRLRSSCAIGIVCGASKGLRHVTAQFAAPGIAPEMCLANAKAFLLQDQASEHRGLNNHNNALWNISGQHKVLDGQNNIVRFIATTPYYLPASDTDKGNRAWVSVALRLPQDHQIFVAISLRDLATLRAGFTACEPLSRCMIERLSVLVTPCMAFAVGVVRTGPIADCAVFLRSKLA